MNIRSFQESDYERAQGLLETVQAFHVEQRPDIYKEIQDFVPQKYYGAFLNNPEELSAVAEIDGVLAGICLVSAEKRACNHPVLTPRKYGSVEVLCVDPAFRRQGVAEHLMNYVKSRAEELGLDGLDLGVTAFNFPAKALYEKMGFTVRHYKMEWKIEKEIENNDTLR